jgi:hypothetical protein
VWPFATGSNKCKQLIECKYAPPTLQDCGGVNIVADDVEFNGEARCLPLDLDPAQGERFDCSTGGKPTRPLNRKDWLAGKRSE